MNYRNSEMKIDQLVAYLNDEKINLSPAFQRGHVWKPGTRKKLVKNIVALKPIPAVFLYKEASGSKYSYNILDGKQRLESLILFIGNARADFAIKNWDKYFHGEAQRRMVHYGIETSNGRRMFKDLDDIAVRDFREYAIPTIEITLGDESSLDEIITLFVDINQQGEPVKRFDIVKALCKTDPLLKGVFDLLAQEERRGQDVFYKSRQTPFTAVLKRLAIIDAIPHGNARVDRMWERLLEIALFVRTSTHRKPVEILREFMAAGGRKKQARLDAKELKKLREIFAFLKDAYKGSLGTSRVATDQTHFYTMVTSMSKSDLLARYGESQLLKKLEAFAALLTGATKAPAGLKKPFESYRDLSVSKTTDASRRVERDRLFTQIIDAV